MIKEFHPNLLPRVRKLAIRANRRVLSNTLTGNWLSSFKGRGIEFSDYRVYSPGDDANQIDWRASLKARKMLVKELAEEKNLNVFIFMDASNSMLYGSNDVLKAEVAAEIASTLAYVAIKAGDAVGLVMFTDKMSQYVQPNIGTKQHNIIMNLVAKPESWGGGFDFQKSLSQFMGVTKEKGLIIILSDFIGMGEKWKKYLEIASGRFELLGLIIRDPRDRTLPKHAGEYLLADPFEDEAIVIDCEEYYQPYKDYVLAEEERIQEYFRMVRGDTLLIQTDQDYSKSLVSFFQKRQLRVGR